MKQLGYLVNFRSTMLEVVVARMQRMVSRVTDIRRAQPHITEIAQSCK